MNTIPPLIVIVRDRTNIIYHDTAHAVTSVNERGEFDVLSQHENFISLIKEKLIIRPVTGEPKTIDVTRGVIRVHDNTVTVYIGVLPQYLSQLHE